MTRTVLSVHVSHCTWFHVYYAHVCGFALHVLVADTEANIELPPRADILEIVFPSLGEQISKQVPISFQVVFIIPYVMWSLSLVKNGEY